MSLESASSSTNGISMIAASAAPPARPAPSASRRTGSRGRRSRETSARAVHPSATTTSTWKLDDGWPPRNCSPTAAASPATGSGPGRRTHSSLSRHTHGRSTQTLPSVHDTQLTAHRLKPKTSPVSSAPAKRMRSARPSRKAPNAATKIFSTAVTASDFQKGST